MAWTNPPRTWTDGELVTAAIMNTHARDQLSLVPHVVYKTADQSVTSSTALVDDTHLQFAIGANEAWVFRFVMATTGPGFLKVAFNAPATASGWWQMNRGTTGTMNVLPQSTATFVDGETKNTTDTPDIPYIDGYVTVTAGGTFKLRWAQNASNGTATILRKGSFMWTGRVT